MVCSKMKEDKMKSTIKNELKKYYIIREILRFKRRGIHVRKPYNEHYNKVFCVGWVKTGTTSFAQAMRRLGFKHQSFDVDIWRKWYGKGDIHKIINHAKYFDSFDDLPWNKTEILERFDSEFPNSKFILLERDSEQWFNSLIRWRKTKGKDTALDKDSEIKYYEERNQYIRDYFSGDKKDQLLIMNLANGDGYKKLCPFLHLPVLDEPFFHSNQTSSSPSKK